MLAQAILIVGENFHESFQGSETVDQRFFIIKAVHCARVFRHKCSLVTFAKIFSFFIARS